MVAFPQQFTSTVSHWQQTNRGPTSLWNHNRDAPLPTDQFIDYVIIGAGISGTSLAYHLSRPGAAGDGKSIVILDAKDVASCASGRNGGHVPMPTWRVLPSYTTPLEQGGAGLTPEDVLDILMFQQDNLDLVEQLVRDEQLDADFKRAPRYEVLTAPESVAENERLRGLFYEVLHKSSRHKGRDLEVEVVSDAAKAQEITRIPSALAANLCVAGSWHPHRATTGLMHRALQSSTSDVQFFSWAPVASFRETPDGTITVDCGARGTLKTRNLVLASLTCYHLEAGLTVPPATYSGEQALGATYAIENGAYLIQTKDSGLVFGPYGHVSLRDNLMTVSELYGNEDDSTTSPAQHAWMRDYCSTTFSNWGDENPQGEGLTKHWSGVESHAIDHRPFVGRVPGHHAAVYMLSGFSGMGMSMIPNITRGLAQMLANGGQWDDEAVPRCFEITQERLDLAAKSALRPV